MSSIFISNEITHLGASATSIWSIRQVLGLACLPDPVSRPAIKSLGDDLPPIRSAHLSVVAITNNTV